MNASKTGLAQRPQRFFLASIAALASAGIITTVSATSSAATDSFGAVGTPVQLHNANGGCLDLPNGNTTDGTFLQIWACDANGQNQTWFMDSGGAVHFAANPSKCLDLPNGNQVDQARIQIWDCDNGASQDQQWSYAPNGDLQKLTNGVAGKCIELLDGSAANGNIVHLFDCNGTSGQTWFPLLGSEANPVQLTDGNGGCLDLPSGNTTNGTKLQIWACDGNGLNQSWYQDSGGAIHYAAAPNKCLDLPNGNQVDQARIQIWDCDNGASQDQQWRSEPGHTLQKFSNGVAGKCMELLDGSASNGNIVQIFDCNATSGQTWFPRAFTLPGSLTWNWGEDDFGGGGIHGMSLTVSQNGSYTFSGAFWENVFPGCSTGESDAAVIALPAANGDVLTFSRNGSLPGGCGSQNDTWSLSGTNAELTSHWIGLQGTTPQEKVSFSLDTNGLWNAIASVLGVVSAVISIVSA